MTGPILDKRITALENELEALRRRKLAMLKNQLQGMGVATMEHPRAAAGGRRQVVRNANGGGDTAAAARPGAKRR